jgi:2-haloacid dehalogenase
MDFRTYEVLTFDCYGTLIDWETGIVRALQPVLAAHGVQWDAERLLELYAEVEATLEAGPYLPYREVLRQAMEEMGHRLGFQPTPSEREALVRSLGDWPPFPDTVEALQTLKRRYRLALLSNVDDDLFALSARHLRVEWDWVITAEQVGSYKPSLRPFRVMLERIGRPPERVLHVAQSLYHDIAPAKRLGLTTIWVNRRRGKSGSGATPPAEVQPDGEVPDLRTLVQLIERAWHQGEAP